MNKNLSWLSLFCFLSLMLIVGCDSGADRFIDHLVDDIVIPAIDQIVPDELPLVCTAKTTVENTSDALLYYPCVMSGKMAATTLTSGANAGHAALAWLATEIADNNFVVLAMTPTETAGPNSLWRDAHLSGIAKLESLNAEPGKLQNRIDTDKLQMCGHSRGGSGALMAAAILGSKVKATIAMAPYPEDFDNLDGITSATLIQCGGLDIFVTPKMAAGVYNLLPAGISKGFFEYTNAHHASWGTFNLQLMHETLNEDIVAWMKYYLDGDTTQAYLLSDRETKTTTLWEDHGTSGR